MARYRVIVKVWDRHFGEGHAVVSRHYEARASKKADNAAVDVLEAALKVHAKPQGRIATAWAERSDMHGPMSLRSYDGTSGTWLRVK